MEKLQQEGQIEAAEEETRTLLQMIRFISGLILFILWSTAYVLFTDGETRYMAVFPILAWVFTAFILEVVISEVKSMNRRLTDCENVVNQLRVGGIHSVADLIEDDNIANP